MKRIRLLKTTYLSAYLYALRQNDVNPAPYLQQHGIPGDFEFLNDYMLPARLLHQFIQSAVGSCRPGVISTVAGLYNATHQSNPFADSLTRRRDLAGTIGCHNANVARYSPENRFDLKLGGDQAHWRKLGRSPTPETEIFCVANLVGHVRSIAGKTWRPDSVRVAVADPEVLRAQPLLAAVPVYRQRNHTSVSFAAALLSKAQAGQRASEPPALAIGEPADSDFVSTLRMVMKAYARTGDLTADNMAEASGLSRRTLQRHLGELGLSYRTLADQVRFEVAGELLLTELDLGVTQIGYELGYRDPGSFSRAFRRLAGVTPTAYRRARTLHTSKSSRAA